MHINQKLPVKEKIGYGLGDTASNLYFQMFINFLLFFYTDVFGIPAAVAGTLFMVSRFWDAVNDPMMGAIADRTNTKWGKFRPYLIWIMLPLAVIGVLMFTTPNLDVQGKIIYAYITYILMMMTYTAINIPYSALMGVLSPDSMQRTSASTYRFVLAFVGAFIVQGATLVLVNSAGNVDTGFALSGNMLMIQEVDTRTSKIIIEASDGERSASCDFLINIHRKGELPPAIQIPMDDLNLEQGFGTKTLDLSQIFSGQNGKSLSFDVNNSSDEVIGTELTGSKLVLKEKGAGRSELTLTARDESYAQKNFTMTVSVNAAGNHPPVALDSLPDMRTDLKSEAETIDLGRFFADQDSDALTYQAVSKNKSAVSAEISGSMLTLIFHKSGISTVELTAGDSRGGQVESAFNVIVRSSANDAPALFNPPADLSLNEGFGKHVIDISGSFRDPDGDAVTYSVKKVDLAKGFQFTMIVFGILSCILFYITFRTTRERVQPPGDQKTSLKNDLKDLVGNRPWMILLVMGIFTLGYVIIRMGAIMYFFKYYIGNEMLASLFMVLGTVAVIAGVACTEFLSRRLGKKKLYLIVMGMTTILTALFYHIPKEQIVLVFTVHILISFVMAPQAPLLWAMYADTADYSEWKNKRRATGLVFSAATFAQKFGMALGGGLAGWLLSVFRFQPNVEQTAEALLGIRLMMSYIPAIGTLIAVAAAFFYELDDKTMKKIEKDLADRKLDQ
jgi:GPH family glycoside/pentoside/hexuronide:cation symporter